MLSRRELSERDLRRRLARKGYRADAVDAAVGRLLESRALDDRRVALAAARTHAHVKRQGRDRVARELSALGISVDVAREALAEVFGALDEQALLEQALDKRLRPRHDLRDPAVQRRLFAALVRQGFDGHAVGRALRARARKQTARGE
jgi:regulatory protein